VKIIQLVLSSGLKEQLVIAAKRQVKAILVKISIETQEKRSENKLSTFISVWFRL